MESASIYSIDNAILFILLGTFCWFLSLTIDQKFHWLGNYSLYIGYFVGILIFIVISYLYYRWTKQVGVKYNLTPYEKHHIKYRYLKLTLFLIAFWLLWFLIIAFFAFIIDLEL